MYTSEPPKPTVKRKKHTQTLKIRIIYGPVEFSIQRAPKYSATWDYISDRFRIVFEEIRNWHNHHNIHSIMANTKLFVWAKKREEFCLNEGKSAHLTQNISHLAILFTDRGMNGAKYAPRFAFPGFSISRAIVARGAVPNLGRHATSCWTKIPALSFSKQTVRYPRLGLSWRT